MSRILFGIAATVQAIKSRPDVIFCGHIFHGPLALVLAKMTGAKLVSQLHGTEVWQALGWLHLQPLLRSNLVLCVSRDTRARYTRQAGPADNSFVLANTVGPVFSVGDRAAAHDRFGVTGHCVLLSVARLDTRDGYKGQDRVIAALPNLRSPRGEPITYLIAGSGADRGRLEQIAAQHGVTEQVRFLGKVSEADLPDLYRAADLFVLPSTGEGFGIVYLEAMACGTPALGLAIGGTADPLGDGALGRLLPAEADIFDSLQELLLSEKPDPADLSRTVRAQFGLEAFQLRVSQAIARVTGQSAVNVAGTHPSSHE